jgi:protein SCO1/2
MNIKIFLALAVWAWADVRGADGVGLSGASGPGDAKAPSSAAVPPSCCVVAKKAPRCCVAESTISAAAVRSDRSLYQVESNWIDDRGEAVRLQAFQGHPVIVAMFFAQCEYACPLIVSDIQRTLAALPPEARAKTRVLLVTFDPARDTPAALEAYRKRAALDSAWTLVRGEAGAVQELAMLLGVRYKQDARGQFSHSNLITVLNRGGEISYQRAGLQGDVSELAKAVVLAAE